MALLRFIERVNRVMAPIGIGALLVMMSIVTINVLGRATINAPFFGTVETVELSGAIMVSGILAYTQFQRQNIAVTMLTDRMPKKLKQSLDVFSLLLGLVFVSLLIWTSSSFALSIPKELTNIFQIARLPFRLTFSFGLFILFLVYLGQLMESLIKVVKQ